MTEKQTIEVAPFVARDVKSAVDLPLSAFALTPDWMEDAPVAFRCTFRACDDGLWLTVEVDR
jgi:hypothetical protein